MSGQLLWDHFITSEYCSRDAMACTTLGLRLPGIAWSERHEAGAVLGLNALGYGILGSVHPYSHCELGRRIYLSLAST